MKMSDENNEIKTNLRVLEFDKRKERSAESNKVISDMFLRLSERALEGDIDDFVITFKSTTRGIESMIGAGGGVYKFDFVGYIGMLEVLKQRLMGIMSQMTYAYEHEAPKKKDEEPKNEQPIDPENEP